jgi:hypothetical protein
LSPATKARRRPQPAYHSDPALSDLFLFDFLKQELHEIQIPEWENLKHAKLQIIREVDRGVPDSVFLDRLGYLEWVGENEGKICNGEIGSNEQY